MDSARAQVLRMLHNGAINAEEAARLLNAIGNSAAGGTTVANAAQLSASAHAGAQSGPAPAPTTHAEQPEAESAAPPASAAATAFPPPCEVALIGQLCRAVLAFSLAAMAGAAVGMASSFGSLSYITPWFVFLWGVFVTATLLAGLSLWARSARWVHLRVQTTDADVRLSLPLPVQLAVWALQMARPFARRRAQADALVDLLRSAEAYRATGQPLYVEFHDDDERAQVYIG